MRRVDPVTMVVALAVMIAACAQETSTPAAVVPVVATKPVVVAPIQAPVVARVESPSTDQQVAPPADPIDATPIASTDEPAAGPCDPWSKRDISSDGKCAYETCTPDGRQWKRHSGCRTRMQTCRRGKCVNWTDVHPRTAPL